MISNGTVGLHVRIGSDISHSSPSDRMYKYIGATAIISNKKILHVNLVFDEPGLQQLQDMEVKGTPIGSGWNWSPKDLELVKE